MISLRDILGFFFGNSMARARSLSVMSMKSSVTKLSLRLFLKKLSAIGVA